MKKMTQIMLMAGLLLGIGFTDVGAEEPERARSTAIIPATPSLEKPPLIQMAILLDNSGSMGGLINQARSQLWSIVNEFATARRDGNVPELQVALFKYGRSQVSAEKLMMLPLTTDLDKVSEKLFAIEIGGGTEYCGKVIKAATDMLKWSEANNDLKVIFIAGNEPFTQGKVDYQKACQTAIGRGIIVNTIHCGGENAGIQGKWKHGAMLADGKFMNINQNTKVVHIESPHDKEIERLNRALNSTYIPYGENGANHAARQVEQDDNATRTSKRSSMQRAEAKSSAQYRNESWDLVDAVKNNKKILRELKEKDLPEEMQKMSPAERKEHVKKMAKKREDIQKEIVVLNKQRKKYVTQKRKEMNKGKENTLETAVIEAIRSQAGKKSFSFKDSNETNNETK